VTLRRLASLQPSRGTVIPFDLRQHVVWRDRARIGGNGCVGRYVGMPFPCGGTMELDHVRASGALGMKSETSAANLVLVCAAHHNEKTLNGRLWRPLFVEYLAKAEG
jgi:hypothetical protein